MKNPSINTYTFVLTGLFSLFSITALAGCQTIKQDPSMTSATEISTETIVPIIAKVPKPKVYDEAIITFPQSNNADYDKSLAFPELPVSSLNRYNWQLVRWIDNQDFVTEIVSEQPVILDIRHNNLIFNYGCERYRIVHSEIIEGKYSSHAVSNITLPSCSNDERQSTLNHSLLAEQLQSASVESYLNSTFAPFSRSRFYYELLTSKPNSYQLALKLNNKTLVFTGTIKPLKTTLGLPISYEFLKRYQWRLVSAIDNDKKTIIELSRPGFPVTAYFGYSFNDEHHVGFSANCNGVGGPYTLSPDNTLIIGSGSQTLMGCGPKREAAEDKIKALEQRSKSQLKLEKLANINTDNPELPYYLLTQKLETGETLIWKNSAIADKR